MVARTPLIVQSSMNDVFHTTSAQRFHRSFISPWIRSDEYTMQNCKLNQHCWLICDEFSSNLASSAEIPLKFCNSRTGIRTILPLLLRTVLFSQAYPVVKMSDNDLSELGQAVLAQYSQSYVHSCLSYILLLNTGLVQIDCILHHFIRGRLFFPKQINQCDSKTRKYSTYVI